MGIKDNSEANTVISSLEFNFEARRWADRTFHPDGHPPWRMMMDRRKLPYKKASPTNQ